MDDCEQEFSLKHYFVPLTTLKAIHLIILIGLVVYANMFFNGFIGDDMSYIINNTQIHTFNIVSLFGTNYFNDIGQYRPLTAIYFSILYVLFGTHTFFYHFLQLFLHILCTIVVYLVFRKFLSSGISLLVSVIFLVHTINVESVSNIAHTDSPLFLLFGLLAFMLCRKKMLYTKHLSLIFILLILSLLTKEASIFLLFLIPLYRYLFVRKDVFVLMIVMFITMVTYFSLRIFIGHVGLQTRLLAPIADLPLLARLQNIPEILFYYLSSFIFPNRLAIDQEWVITTLTTSNFYLPLLADCIFFLFIGFIGLFIIKYNKNASKPFLFFLIWFLLGLLLYMQIYPLDYTVADRWFYFPLVGLLGIVGLFLQTMYHAYPSYTKYLAAVFFCYVVILAVLTTVRNYEWSDPITLYAHDNKISDNYDLENLLGTTYFDRGDYVNALVHVNKSIALRPYEYNFYNKGAIYENIGSIDQAKKYYQMALAANNYNMFYQHKHDIQLYVRYSYLLVFFNSDYVQANAFIKNALHDYPQSADLWILAALLNEKDHERETALADAFKGYMLNPSEKNRNILQSLQEETEFTINLDGHSFHIK